MKGPPVQHPDADRLLELAYGELSETEAASLHTHVAGCEACGQALEEIGGVRRVMAPLGEVQAPQGGLESLMAYAEQSASRAREAPPQKRRWFLWGLVPVALTGLLVVGGGMDSVRARFGTSAQALAGETVERGSGAIPGPVAFGGPGAENRPPDADPFAREIAALESRSARAPEQKRRKAEGGEGTMARAPAESASPPPPPPPAAQLRAPHPARARSAPARPERRAESAPSPALAGFDDSSVRSGGAPSPEASGALGGASGALLEDASQAESAAGGMAEAEEAAPREALADREGAFIEGRGQDVAAVSAAPAPRRAREAERQAKAAPVASWSVPADHTERIRARESLRAQVAIDGGALGLAETLGRLCRLEDALEEHTAADATCRRLLDLDPDSPHSDFARTRTSRRGGR